MTTYDYIRRKRDRLIEKPTKKQLDKKQEKMQLQEESKKKEENSLIYYSKGVTAN